MLRARTPLLRPLAPLLFSLLAGLGACSSSDETGRDQGAITEDELACEPKDERSCSCGKQKGVSVCSKAGAWGACACESGDDPRETMDAGKRPSQDAGSGKRTDAGTPAKPTEPSGGEPGEKSDEKSALPCDVGAILTAHCGECHGEETAFGAPMSLVSWEDLQAPAPKTKGKKTFDVTLARVKDDAKPMPPAPHERLSDADVKVLEDWIAAGAPRGESSCEGGSEPGAATGEDGVVPKPEDCESEFELRAHGGSTPDDKSKFATSATPALEGNQYHCFFFDPPYASDEAMFWFQPIIDNKASLHHWILYATDHKKHPSGTSAGCNASEPGAYFVAGWAPGANNAAIADDVSLQLPTGPNAGLILEVHYYNNTGKPQEDASGIRFCTGKKSKRQHLAAVHTLGSEGICINPGASSEVAGTCAPRQDMGDIHITGMWPHMHKLARRMKVTVKRKGGGTDVIHDAPFDFNSQIFHAKQDIVIKPGDTLETRCYFTNDTNAKVKFGERTQDEMCYAFIMAWPAGSLVSPPGPLSNPATDLLNRCADPLSILQSCNGIADRPMNVDHP